MPVLARTCSICGKMPTLYFSRGKLFCKAHKAEAEAWARNAFKTTEIGHVRNSGTGNTEYMDQRRKYKRDHPIGRVVAK